MTKHNNLYKDEVDYLESKTKEKPIPEPKSKRIKTNNLTNIKGIIFDITSEPNSYNNKTTIFINDLNLNRTIKIHSYNKISNYFNKNYRVGDKIECDIKTKIYNNINHYFITYIKKA